MTKQDLMKQTEEIRPGDHVVALYEDESEITEYLAGYIRASLMRNERCLYITDEEDVSRVFQQIKEFPEVDNLLGNLVVLDKTDAYAKNGKFDPDKMITLVCEHVTEALEAGFSALSITGEISWVLDYDDGEELIIEYEWKLNEQVFNKYPVTALCRYNITKFSYEMIKNVIQVHPVVLWKDRIHDNPYYIPAEGFKNNEISKHQVENWLHNIFIFTDEKSRFRSIVEKSQEDMRKLHQTMTKGIITAFLQLLEMHDSYTKDHCTNVANLSVQLAGRMDQSDEFIAKLYYAALVHDIGKTIIPKVILEKPGRLNPEEYEVIKKHSIFGADALKEIDTLGEISLAVRHHHERADGKGYPDQLRNEDTPLMSKIIAICDAYDAITNERSYREARSHEEALVELQACSGSQFDKSLLHLFIGLFS